MNPKLLEIKKNGIYVIEPHVYYLHAKFQGNPSMFGTQIIQKFSKTTHIKIFNYIFWKFYTTDKDKNCIVKLALESCIE